ncbi:DUF6503 family protein [Winogradskyella psychrotolerans]|uniref:DUF6503 family protein n=1 Tax=Winogradskyella psychrotolerans TaxID=1344585 RepID=UPI001C07476D|nr:DUF6503 family protein [Winogradskyella psychrotolerans]MBU2926891.1 hypothetical protein [Winogradskyella psychrotolerans]
MVSRIFKSSLVCALLLTLATSCKSEKKETIEVETSEPTTIESKELTLVETIEKAYHKDLFLAKDAIELDMVISFGGKERLDAKMTYLTNSTKGKIELKDGTFIYYDGDKVFHSPDFKNEKAVRFDAYTWMYFLLFHTKMSDPGTIWTTMEAQELRDKTYNAQRLTFEANTGDAPDDWYIVYSDPETHMMDYVAYIVTVNKSTEAAEADPHAIGYSNYKMIDGLPIAHNWEFYEWSKTEGIGKVIGEATIKNVKFITPETDTFTIPEGFVEK